MLLEKYDLVISNQIEIDEVIEGIILTSDTFLGKDKAVKAAYDILKDSEIVTYCQGAYRAANSFLVLKKLGFKNVKVYLGSWGEWGNDMELSVE